MPSFSTHASKAKSFFIEGRFGLQSWQSRPELLSCAFERGWKHNKAPQQYFLWEEIIRNFPILSFVLVLLTRPRSFTKEIAAILILQLRKKCIPEARNIDLLIICTRSEHDHHSQNYGTCNEINKKKMNSIFLLCVDVCITICMNSPTLGLS